MQQLVAFSIGPVQSFIASSRKTTDLWGGSFLLSELTETAMALVSDSFGMDSVEWIQPRPMIDGNTARQDTASFPNRFLCLVTSNENETKEKLRQVENNLKSWLTEKGVNSVAELFHKKSLTGYINTQVNEQLQSALEIFWAFVPYSDQDSYHEQRLEVESMLASVKNNRPVSYDVQHDLVCTVCHQREALTAKEPTEEATHYQLKEAMRDLWKPAWEDPSRAKEHEYLCSVCAVKRMRRKMLTFPPFPSVRAFNTFNLNHEVLNEEGDPESLEGTDQERYYAVVFFDGDDMGQWISGAKSESNKATIEESKTITEKLSRFASTGISESAKDKNIRVIYSGGDDVLAIGSIMDILDFTQEIRQSFSDPTIGFDKRATGSAGIVIAPEKAPLQQVMNYGRQAEARAKAYKNSLDGSRKDAFTIHFLRNSGQQRRMTLPFTTPIPELTPDWFNMNGKNILLELIKMANKWKHLELSPQFIYHFHREFQQVAAEWEYRDKARLTSGKPFQSNEGIELIRGELTRLINHSAMASSLESADTTAKLADELSSLYLIHRGDFTSYIHLLEMLRYLSRLPKMMEEESHV